MAQRLIFVFDLLNGLDISDPQNRPRVFRHMVKFSKYAIFSLVKAFWGLNFIFCITLGHDVNHRQTPWWFRSTYHIVQLVERIVRISSTTWISLYFPCLTRKRKGENYIKGYVGTVQTLSIVSVINNQHIATKHYTSIVWILLGTFPLSQQWSLANMHKRRRKVLKIYNSPRWL